MFDENNILISGTKYQLGNELVRKTIYNYDNKKRLLEYKNYNERDSLYEQFSYRYGNDSLITERKIYYRNDLESTTTYQYLQFDKRGNWVKRTEHEIEGRNTTNRIVFRSFKYFR